MDQFQPYALALVIITWGWPFVGVMTLLAGLAMAEVCSSFPTAGGLYYWAAKLAPPKSAVAWSWFTGWFNFLGQVAVTAGIDFGAAFFLNALLNLQWGFDTRPWHTIVLFAAILLLHGAVNQFGVDLIGMLNRVSVWWPWQLGRWSRPIGALAVLWVAFITALFMLPTTSPITALDGVSRRLPLPPPVTGNAYAVCDVARVPTSLAEATALWEGSMLAREAFGKEVVDHYANMARVELEAYRSAVTDWELRRYFERI